MMSHARFHPLLPRVLVLLAGLFAALPVHAQERSPVQDEATARSAVYLELLGSGIFYTINYDRKFTDDVTGRIGLMVISTQGVEDERARVVLVPVLANYLFGQGSHRLEAGAGGIVAYADGRLDVDETTEGLEDFQGMTLFGTATLGYRYQPVRGGFVFRIGLTPLFTLNGVGPLAGISFGYAF